MKKRMLSILIALTLCLGLLPAPAAAARTIVTGPSKSFEAALREANHGDTIDITAGAHIGTQAGAELTPFVIDKSVTISGGDLSLWKGGLLLEADVTFQNMTLSMANRCHDAIFANGYTLTLDSVKCLGWKVDLFGGNLYTVGGSTDSPQVTPFSTKSGNGGSIVIRGTNTGFGNIYAGSMNGAFDKPVTIQYNGSIDGSVYACGALEGTYDSSDWFGGTEPGAPTANAGRYPVTGAVTIELNKRNNLTIEGQTGGSSNASVIYTANENDYLYSPLLKNIASLSLRPGSNASGQAIIANLSPASGSTFSANAAVAVPTNTRLHLTNMDSNLAIGSLAGGGQLILEQQQSLTITGAVTASTPTKVGIGSLSFNQANSMTQPYSNHNYIVAANSKDGDFKLLPHALSPNQDLVRNEQGGWSIPTEQTDTILIESVSVNKADVTVPADNTGVFIPVNVVYDESCAMWAYLSFVRASVLVNGRTVNPVEDEYGNFTYTSGSGTRDIKLYFTTDSADSSQEVLVIRGAATDGTTGTIPVGTHTIYITIPKENTTDDTAKTISVTLTVEAAAPSSTDLTGATVTVNPNTNLTYTGSQITPGVSVQLNGSVVSPDNYTVTYGTNVNAGTNAGTVTVTGKGSYTGTASATFTIAKAQPTAADFQYSAPTNLVYSGTAKAATITSNKNGMGAVTVKYSADPTQAGTYTVSIDVAEGSNYKAASNLSGSGWSFVITKPTLTITAKPQTVSVGESIVSGINQVQTVGLVGGDSLSAVTLTSSDTGTATANGVITPSAARIQNGSGADVSGSYNITYHTGVLTVSDHQHQWSYTASGGTITATCGTGHCPLPGGQAVITVAAPAERSYTGRPIEVMVSVEPASAMTAPTAVYNGNGLVGGKPVNSGEYTASIELGGVSARISFEIIPRPIDGANVGDFAPMTYSARAQAPSAPVTLDGVSVTGTWSPVTNVADRTTFTASGNYTGTIENLNPGMTPKTIRPEDVILGAALTYNGTQQTQTVTVTGLTEGRDYTVEGNTATNAGDYTLTVTGQDNHIGTVTRNWNIGKAGLTMTSAPTASTVSYGQRLSSSTLSGGAVSSAVSGGSVPGTWHWADSTTRPTSTGHQKATFTPDDPNNYHVLNGQSVSVTVKPATPTLIVSLDHSAQLVGKNVTVMVTAANPYDDTFTEKLPTEFKLTYIIGADTHILTGNSFAIPSHMIAGSVITITAVSSAVVDRYMQGRGSATVMVTDKLIPHLSVADITMTYTGNPVPDGMISGSARTEDGADIPGTWAFAAGQDLTDVVHSGMKTVVFTPSDSNTYAVVQTTAQIRIQKAPGVGSVSMAGWTEGEGASEPVPISATNGVDGVSYQYKARGAADSTYTKIRPSSAGVYTIRATFPATDNHTEATATADFTIAPVDQPNKPNDPNITHPITFGGNSGSVSSTSNTTNSDGRLPSSPTVTHSFTDVEKGSYYESAVAWAVHKGITTGLTATAFGPNTSCTRAQTITFLWRAAGSPEPQGTSHSFTDVSTDAYYHKAILWAVEKGITTGVSATSFAPETTVSRSQVMTFLWRLAGSVQDSGSHNFTDVDSGDYYHDAVLWASRSGVTQGTSTTTFSPKDDCVRAQIITFLYRYFSK